MSTQFIDVLQKYSGHEEIITRANELFFLKLVNRKLSHFRSR